MDQFGLTHTCTGELECEQLNFYCIDSLSTGEVCEVSCEEQDSCKDVTVVVANSGGLRLHCSGHRTCLRTSVQWVNSANLAVYQSIHENATLGGALHLVECIDNNFACHSLNVKGDTQELELETVTEWNCGGGVNNVLSCVGAIGTFLGSVQVNCIGQQSCYQFSLTCLSGANCETTALDSAQTVDATMYCDVNANSCVCSKYWNCLTIGTTQRPTTTLLPTTSETPATTELKSTTSEEPSTTKTPTTTTATPTSTTKTPTTTKMHTTTTAKASSSTTKADTSTSQMSTMKPTNTTSLTAMQTTLPETTDGSSKRNGADIDWLTIGAVVGCFVALFCVAAVFYFWWRNRRLSKQTKAEATTIRIGVLSVSADATVPEYDCGSEKVPGNIIDGAEQCQMEEALQRVTERDERDLAVGRMLVDMNAGNELLRDDVIEAAATGGLVEGGEESVSDSDEEVEGDCHATAGMDVSSGRVHEFDTEEKAQEYVTRGMDGEHSHSSGSSESVSIVRIVI